MKNQRFYVCFCLFSLLFINIFTLNVNLIYFQSSFKKNSSVLQASIQDQDYWPTNGWLTATPEEQEMDGKTLSKMYDYIEEEQANIHSVIVVRNGYIVEEGYLTYYKLRAVNEDYSQEMHVLHSVTKTIVSLCIGVALKMGYIDNLSQTFFDIFPELWKPSYDLRKKNITIEHLLTMTSGIEWDEWSTPYGNPGNDYSDMVFTSDWVQYYLDKPMEYDPGKNFRYSGGSSMLLSALIQKVTNQTTSDFVDQNLFTPLGILEDQWRWDYGSQGINEGGSGLKMTPRDMAKIGLLCFNNGTWDGEEIISKSYVEKQLIKGERVAIHNKENCTGCFNCVQRCQFGAIAADIRQNKVQIDAQMCFGCGLCESVCNDDAIELKNRRDFPILRYDW